MRASEPMSGRRILWIRLAIGLAQGIGLFCLYRGKVAVPPVLFGAAWLVLLLAPIAALGAVGRLGRTAMAAWLAGGVAILAALGGYERWIWAEQRPTPDVFAGPAVTIFAAGALFIAHHLLTAAAAEGRWRAAYDRYFDEGWMDAVRLALTAAFVGALWLLLFLGAQLFKLIGVEAVRELIRNEWFAFPITTTFVALGVHLTDVRSQMTAGARGLILALLSWLLPVLTAFATAFLLTAPFTGLDALWGTRSATGTMLAVCCGLIVLINAVYQDGAQPAPTVLRGSARVAGVVIAPLVGIAAWGLAMRIGQYGLTPARVAAAVILAIAAVYAAGYVAAVVSRGPWMKRVETTNWTAAHLGVAAILLVFSPLLDPARLAVDDQVARLERGAVKAEDFDFEFLRFDAGRWGREALTGLARSDDAEVARLATAAQAQQTKVYVARAQGMALGKINAAPGLPVDFLTQAWPADQDPRSACLPLETGACETIVGEFDGAPGVDIVVVPQFAAPRVYSRGEGGWRQAGVLSGQVCPDDRQAVREGRWRIAPPAPALEIGGRRFVFNRDETCSPTAGAK